MFIKVLLNYILGYVNIKVESFFIERFVNVCISKRIFLWNIKRKKSTILYANIGINDYKKLKQISKKTQSKINIERKSGLPFIMHKYRKRKIFVFLLGAILLGLIVLSNFIWNIEIIGNETIPTEEIVNQLKEDGLMLGTLKSKLNTNLIINKFRLKRDDVAWIGISIKGTNAIISIQEATKAPEILDENEYCNIVCDKTGMINKINVQNGTALVKEGDIVKEGDVLVAGYIEGKYTGTRYVHARSRYTSKSMVFKKRKSTFFATN